MKTDDSDQHYTRNNVLKWSGSVSNPLVDNWDPENSHEILENYDIIVTPDASSEDTKRFLTVQAAIDQTIRDIETLGADTRRHIFIHAGRYQGPIYIPENAPPLTLTGEGTSQTTIAARIDAQMSGREYADRFATNFTKSPPEVQKIFEQITARGLITTGNSAVLRIERSDTLISCLRVENLYACDRPAAAPPGELPDAEGRYAQGQHQAVALHIAGADRVSLKHLELSSFQDTLYLQTPSPFALSRVFLSDCFIEGDVDFIFGGATAYFSECQIKSRGMRGAQSWATAPCTNVFAPYGFVFDKCLFLNDGAEAAQNGLSFLGRQWFMGVRATPYGTPDIDEYECTTSTVSRYTQPIGTINRQTLESVGKCIILNSQIDTHINIDNPWDGWGAPNWSPRYRPSQHSGEDFLRYLGRWFLENGLDYSGIDQKEPWLLVADCQFRP